MGRKKRAVGGMRLPEHQVSGGEKGPAAASITDYLSGLPDEVLLSIVSRLHVIEAVRTCILSRRWRHLPSLLPVVDFLDLSSSPDEKEGKEGEIDWFEKIDRAASANWGLIRRCRLSALKRGEERALQHLANVLAGRGIRELDLCAYADWFSGYPFLHHCKSLTKLELSAHFLTGEPAAIPPPLRCMDLRPRCTELRELSLDGVHICDDVFQVIMSTCLRLERLTVKDYAVEGGLLCKDCPGIGVFLSIKTAPSLRYLQVDYEYSVVQDGFKSSGVDIHAPNLEELDICQFFWWGTFTICAPKLKAVRIHLFDEEVSVLPCGVVAAGLRSLMNNVPNLVSLEMNGTSFECMSIHLVPESFHPSFQTLTELGIDVSLQDNRQATCLAMLLRHCDRLRKLKLFITDEDDSFYNKVPSQPALLFIEHQKMLEQMCCLRYCLREVAMFKLTGGIYEMMLSCFFLKEAHKLKKLTLSCHEKYPGALDIMAKHLPNLRRGSSEVVVDLS